MCRCNLGRGVKCHCQGFTDFIWVCGSYLIVSRTCTATIYVVNMKNGKSPGRVLLCSLCIELLVVCFFLGGVTGSGDLTSIA